VNTRPGCGYRPHDEGSCCYSGNQCSAGKDARLGNHQ